MSFVWCRWQQCRQTCRPRSYVRQKRVILYPEHKSVVAQIQNAELPATAVSLLRVCKRRPTTSWRQHLVTGGTRWRSSQLCRSLSNWTLPGGSLYRHCLRPATPQVALTSKLIVADLIICDAMLHMVDTSSEPSQQRWPYAERTKYGQPFTSGYTTDFAVNTHTHTHTHIYIYDTNTNTHVMSRYSDSIRVGRSGDRIPVGPIFPATVQTGPGAHPASYTMGTGSLPGVKWPGRGVDHLLPSSAEVKKK